MKSLDTIGCGPGTWTARPCAAGVRTSLSIASAASSLRMNSWSEPASSGQRVFRKERDESRPLGVRERRRMDEDIHAADRLDDGFARAKVCGDDLNPRRESAGFSARPDHGADLVARETGSARNSASNQPPRTEDRKPHVHGTIARREKDGASTVTAAYVHDACTSPPYAREATVSRRPASVRRARCERWETE